MHLLLHLELNYSELNNCVIKSPLTLIFGYFLLDICQQFINDTILLSEVLLSESKIQTHKTGTHIAVSYTHLTLPTKRIV